MMGFMPVARQPGLKAPAVHFDGTGYVTRSNALASFSNNKVGLFSCWMRFDNDDDATASILDAFYGALVSAYGFKRRSGGLFHCYINDNGGFSGTDVGFWTTRTITKADGWVHVMASWNAATATAQLYVDGDASIQVSRISNETLSYTRGPVYVGRGSYSAEPFDGDLTEVYFTNEFLDLSNSANRDKFRRGSSPVFLGDNGELPTGNQPALYLSGPASTFHINKGYGGNFSVSGTLTDAPTSP